MVFARANAASYNYAEALKLATAWFDANRCGTGVATDNVFSSWRSACHTADSVDGGFHDAGDHVKFGLPAAFSASAMGWALYEFKSEFDRAGATDKALQELKIFSDYFMNCWSNNSFVIQIGDGGSDHSYWGPPENQTTSRPTYKATSGSPASDICGQTAGALALMYLNYKDQNAAYANRCLATAKELLTFAKTNLGRGMAGNGYYNSSSHFDDLCWAAIWLHVATGEPEYLNQAIEWFEQKNDSGDNPYNKAWTYCWDDSAMGNIIMLYKLTGKQKYYDGIIWNFDWFSKNLTKTPAGLPYINNWGCLRYASAEAGLIYVMYKNFGVDSYNAIANRVIDYCLGDNPKNLCYLTNYGSNAVKHPHHRANEPVMGGRTNGMVGALAGGPDNGDNFTDDVNQYVYTEVALDYNASFLLGCAGRLFVAGGGQPASPTPTATLDPTFIPTASPTTSPSPSPTSGTGYLVAYDMNDWGNGATVNVTIKNNSPTAINNWTLEFSFPGNQKITNLWCAKYSQSGAMVTVSNEAWNGSIPSGASVNFGFNITYSGTNAKPASFTLNGSLCRLTD